MGKLVGAGLLIFLIFLFGLLFFSNKKLPVESLSTTSSPLVTTTERPEVLTTDIQASFAIFTSGTFRVFTKSMYHNLSKDVYIEANNPNIVLVKKPGITWNDFFTTLPFKLSSECLTTGTKETFCTGSKGTLKFYINGEKNNNALSQKINSGDKLLVTFGTDSEEQIKQQINKIPKPK